MYPGSSLPAESTQPYWIGWQLAYPGCLQPLDTTWNFQVDNDFAVDFLRNIEAYPPDRLPEEGLKAASKELGCASCRHLRRRLLREFGPDSGSLAFRLQGNSSALDTEQQPECRVCGLISSACYGLVRVPDTTVEIQRTGSNLYLKGDNSPLLSLCFWPGIPANTVPVPRTSGTAITGSTMIYDHDAFGGSDGGFKIQVGPPDLPSPTSYIFFALLSSWLRECDRSHWQCRRSLGATTTTSLSGGNPRTTTLPTRLLDVGCSQEGSCSQEWRTKIRLRETRSITEKELRNDDVRYLALSHPWGDPTEHTHFSTTRQNLFSRIRDGIPVSNLPPTLRDAVQVTRRLGLRYIWIDTLCIIQGNDGDFDTEAKRMEMVYSMAYCVIAASRATGTSSGFLSARAPREYVALRPLRTKRSASMRTSNKPAASFQGDKGTIYLCRAIDDFQKDVIEGSLNKRGWVLQERALARRTIYFTATQTYFECGAGVRCETLTKMTNHQAAFLGDPNFPNVAMRSTKGARIKLCQALYEMFSTLQFSKAYDRSIAMAGLEQRLIRAFNTQGGYGVFDSPFFGRSLLWQRDGRVTNAMKPIQFPLEKKYYGVPTWSWMASEGVITFMDLPFAGVEWRYETEEVVPPWSATSPDEDSSASITRITTTLSTDTNASSSTIWHTGRTDWSTNGSPVLLARARELEVSLEEADQRIVYDAGGRPAGAVTDADDDVGAGTQGPPRRKVKCIIIGREMKNGKEYVDLDAVKYYVLVVAQRVGEDGQETGEYVRVGVGTLPGGWIDQEGVGEKISVV